MVECAVGFYVDWVNYRYYSIFLYFFFVNDDKPAWYTTFDLEKEDPKTVGWNNKGTFPCSYIRSDSGSRWMADSDVIIPFLLSEFPDRVKALGEPQRVAKNELSSNCMFMKLVMSSAISNVADTTF